ncbi:cation diffusion facilitator family transporter [Arcticibacter tournemirensis]|nr:cation diffusion facilitator family transporter [Arcticibacter tournemirensis]TQM49963.1 cation diffusion facilitator family transporter [Arcticibacter tournemirensis]
MGQHPSARAIRTTQLGIIISIVLVVVKAVAGNLGHSYALIADATETGADILSSALLWLGLKYSLKPADKGHPYGHGKAEPLAAIIISLFLLGAAVWIGFNAFHFINTPHVPPHVFTLWVLLIVIIIKEALFRYVIKVGRSIHSQAVIADAYHHRSDAITSVAAFIGIIIAIQTGYEAADDWAALLAAGLIVFNAFRILRPALNEIMDSAPSSDVVERIKEDAGSVPEVKAVEKCYVRKMGFDYFVDLHILVEAQLTVAEGHRIAHLVKERLMSRDSRIKNALIHVEPY